MEQTFFFSVAYCYAFATFLILLYILKYIREQKKSAAKVSSEKPLPVQGSYSTGAAEYHPVKRHSLAWFKIRIKRDYDKTHMRILINTVSQIHDRDTNEHLVYIPGASRAIHAIGFHLINGAVDMEEEEKMDGIGLFKAFPLAEVRFLVPGKEFEFKYRLLDFLNEFCDALKFIDLPQSYVLPDKTPYEIVIDFSRYNRTVVDDWMNAIQEQCFVFSLHFTESLRH